MRVALCDTLCAYVRDDDDVSYAVVCLPCVSDAEPTYSWLSVFVFVFVFVFVVTIVDTVWLSVCLY